MANTGDILAPKLLADGTFEEVVLTPASIGAATTSTVATLTEDFNTLSTTVSELEVNSIAGLPAALDTLSSDLATLESSLGTLSQQNADAATITGGTAYFDTLEAATDHAAPAGTLTISATGDLLGSGTNRLLGFIAGGATY